MGLECAVCEMDLRGDPGKDCTEPDCPRKIRRRTYHSWQCKARAQGTAGENDPADCDWPVCGCDPHASKVIAALEESGVLKS